MAERRASPRADLYADRWNPSQDTLTVFEQEPHWSGLLDAHGRKLSAPRPPIGFRMPPRG